MSTSLKTETDSRTGSDTSDRVESGQAAQILDNLEEGLRKAQDVIALIKTVISSVAQNK